MLIVCIRLSLSIFEIFSCTIYILIVKAWNVKIPCHFDIGEPVICIHHLPSFRLCCVEGQFENGRVWLSQA